MATGDKSSIVAPQVVKKEAESTGLKLNMDQITRGHSVLTANQVNILFRRTRKAWQFKRPGRGGGDWDYVKKGYMRRTLDSMFGFNWDFEPETSVREAFEVAQQTGSCVIKGKLTCRVLDERGSEIAVLEKGNYGGAEVKFKKVLEDGKKVPLNFANDVKAAATDCFKRCAAVLGIAADIYDAEEFIDIQVKGDSADDDAEERQKHAKEKTKAALKELEKGSKK